MATLRKRKSGWQVQVRKRGYKPLSKTFSRKSEAQLWAKSIESEIERRIFLDRSEAESTLLADALSRYEKEVLPSQRGANREISRIKTIRKHLGQYSLASLTSTHLASYRDTRLQQVGPKTVWNELSLIHRILKTCMVDWGIHMDIPEVRKPKIPSGRDRRIKGGEIEALKNALNNNLGMSAIVEFAIETGMRRGEIVAMCWEHVNLKRSTVHIPVTKTAIPRTIPLSQKARVILERVPRRLDGKVFGIAADSVSQAFSRACRKAGINGLRFHDLRHEATSRLFERGLNMMEVAAITGHRDLQSLKRYTHLSAEKLVEKYFSMPDQAGNCYCSNVS